MRPTAFALIATAGFSLACGAAKERAEEEAMEQIIEANRDGDVEINGGTVTMTNGDGATGTIGTNVALPADFPPDAPKPTGCTPTIASSSPKGNGQSTVAVWWDCEGGKADALLGEMDKGFASWTQGVKFSDPSSGTIESFTTPDGKRTATLTVSQDGTKAVVMLSIDT